MNDRIIAALQALDLGPCSCVDPDSDLCPSCARDAACDRLRVQAPTWREVRAAILADIEAEIARSTKERDEWSARFHHTFPDTELARRDSRVTALEWAAKSVSTWFPVPRA